MKLEVVQCPQYGRKYGRTNPRKEYCTGACRVAAHRDKHGYQKPIFDKEQARLVEQIALIKLEDFEQLVEHAIRYRILIKLLKKEKYFDSGRETLFQEVNEKIKAEENEDKIYYREAYHSAKFIEPVKGLLEYTEQDPNDFYGEMTLIKDGDKWVSIKNQ